MTRPSPDPLPLRLVVLTCLLAVAAIARGQPMPDGLRLNQIQVIGSHNSYKLAPEPALLTLIRTQWPEADDIDYAHLPLTDQLNLGARNLELDVYADPEGGRYAHPLGQRLLRGVGASPMPFDPAGDLARPGFKLIHQADFDFRSTVLLLDDALGELAAWSRAHPAHLPVVVTMNCKAGKGRFPGSVEPVPFDARALADLDAVLVAGLGRERLLTPDDVRASYESLPEALAAEGWPTLDRCRGRFIFLLDHGGELLDLYAREHPGLRGRAMFATAEEGSAEAAIFVVNDPIASAGDIQRLVRAGFIVRTRADADTREARKGDLTRFEAAKASGAQVITTDYFIPDRKIHPTYRVRFGDGSFVRVNPLTGR